MFKLLLKLVNGLMVLDAKTKFTRLSVLMISHKIVHDEHVHRVLSVYALFVLLCLICVVAIFFVLLQTATSETRNQEEPSTKRRVCTRSCVEFLLKLEL